MRKVQPGRSKIVRIDLLTLLGGMAGSIQKRHHHLDARFRKFRMSEIAGSGSVYLIEKGRRVRVAINDAHLTAQHIDELREGIDTTVAEQPTQTGNIPASPSG